MWGMLVELAAWGGSWLGKKFMQRRALSLLVKRGVLPTGSKLTPGRLGVLERMTRKGFDADDLAQRIYSAKGGRRTFVGAAGAGPGRSTINAPSIQMGGRVKDIYNRGRLGRAASTNADLIPFAQRNAAAAFRDAGQMMQGAQAFGAASKFIVGATLAREGWNMFAGADRFFEKNIPSPAQEILQTQQMFLPRQAYTQRQRAIQAIHQSNMTTRAALGNEAAYMHG